jgi:putative chitinase
MATIIPIGALKNICVHLHADRAAALETLLNTICPTYGIATGDIMHEYLANVLEESKEFTQYDESLNYSTEALVKKFSRERITTDNAIRYGRNDSHAAAEKEIANSIYGGTWGKINLGNTEPTDGFVFRGAGPIQITGRKNFTDFAAWMYNKFSLKKSAEEWAELLRSSDEYGVHSSCWLFAISKKLIQAAVDDNMTAIVKKINGALTNYPERLKYYELCKKYIPV